MLLCHVQAELGDARWTRSFAWNTFCNKLANYYHFASNRGNGGGGKHQKIKRVGEKFREHI